MYLMRQMVLISSVMTLGSLLSAYSSAQPFVGQADEGVRYAPAATPAEVPLVKLPATGTEVYDGIFVLRTTDTPIWQRGALVTGYCLKDKLWMPVGVSLGISPSASAQWTHVLLPRYHYACSVDGFISFALYSELTKLLAISVTKPIHELSDLEQQHEDRITALENKFNAGSSGDKKVGDGSSPASPIKN